MALDHVLKWYAETIRSPYLHYGYWDEPDQVDPEAIGLADIARAQERYITRLAEVIPDSVHSILDVGCGIGGNAAFLRDRGYAVEVLSPDKYQEEVIMERFQQRLPFHRTRFEDFVPARSYDLVLESESAAYIKPKPGFAAAGRCLRPGGYLLVSDYFIIYDDQSDSPHLRGAHRLETYKREAETAGFKLLEERDVTAHILPTLKTATAFVERFIYPTSDYILYTLRRKHPRILAGLRWLGQSLWDRKQKQLQLIDSEAFLTYRRYKFFLFQLGDKPVT
ncbi:MAG: methyltransferase domain-containing protein [Candidatus Neomarinimicrobiota bacterium]|nr:MAG: methyltransferase domain-containing protein [Candidatus Neomarinimicrobiota bacterium]